MSDSKLLLSPAGDDYDELTGESEIFNGAAMSFYDGPELPEEIGYLVAPCMVQVNRSVSALTGGKNGPAYGLDLFYLYDHDLEQWIQMPPMKTGNPV